MESNCELNLGCYNKRLPPQEEGGEWERCPCALIMHPVRWVCPLGNGCQFGFFGNGEHGTQSPCACRTTCVRCLKWDRMAGGHLICDVCCHELYHGEVRELEHNSAFKGAVQKVRCGKFVKMYQAGTTIDENFMQVPAYLPVSEKTVAKCGRCLKQLHDAAKRAQNEL